MQEANPDPEKLNEMIFADDQYVIYYYIIKGYRLHRQTLYNLPKIWNVQQYWQNRDHGDWPIS